MNRNALCSCGSGKRFKHCCGRDGKTVLPTRAQALAAHRAGSLRQAESLYRRALQENPGDVDVLHMLGVVLLERLQYREALDRILEAAERTDWALPQVRHNLGLVLSKFLIREASGRQARLVEEFLAWERAHGQPATDDRPLVSVVLAAFNHARYVERAIASVAAQTYPNLELVVIDGGSTDGAAGVVAKCVAGMSTSVRVIAGTGQGEPSALNEGAAQARGEYLAFLEPDDHYAPDRLAALVDGIARAGLLWGFSLVAQAPGEKEMPGSGNVASAGSYWQLQRSLLGGDSNSFALVQGNIAVSAGNLFVERDFFRSLGGFRDFRFNYDRDFCLRAAALAEPMVVRRPLYFYRDRAGNTTGESPQRAAEEADRILGAFVATVLSGDAHCTNPLAPQWPENRTLLLARMLGEGMGALVPVAAMRKLAEEMRAVRPSAPVAEHATVVAGESRRTAVVVLGMHRSGTSALARVLNLCGAYLPDELMSPRHYDNPTGFWEPEAIVKLNDRVLRQLGGAWNRVDVPPPGSDFVEEFVRDAQAVLASEYGSRADDPDQGPAHRRPGAAVASGADRGRVPDRLRGSRARAGRSGAVAPCPRRHDGARRAVRCGWRTCSGLPNLRTRCPTSCTSVLGPARRLARRGRPIEDRLGVALDVGTRADEVDRFLEPSLRRQRLDEGALEALVAEPAAAEIRSLYGACLARCEGGANPRSAPPAAASHRIEIPDDRSNSPKATASFVLCIENNAIRDQALLLCESIRTFGGSYRDAPILAFSPRAGLAVDRDTRRALAELSVEYVDEPINTTCTDYSPANRVFAGAWAEARSRCEFTVVLDSDTIFLREPEFPNDVDVMVRPVDAKGSATRGPGDAFEDYWVALAEMCGTSIDRLPYIRSTIEGERIRASYNAGLIVARRDKAIFTRGAELFSRSLQAGIRPYRDSGIDIYASTGSVGRAGSEYWGSSQAVLAIAIWATTDRVVHFPASYNIPLHMVAAKGEIDPVWRAVPPVHVHYHYMFAPNRYEVAMEIMAKLGVPPDRLAWLAAHIPLRDPSRAKQVA